VTSNENWNEPVVKRGEIGGLVAGGAKVKCRSPLI
jgi:hypothetical protein